MNEERNPLIVQFLVDLWPIILINGLFWAVVPGLFFGNLHTDTLEATYWGHDLAWGYSKHPPLLSWVLGSLITPGRSAILQIAGLGQFMAALSAYYIYSLVYRIADRSSAILAGCMMLATGTATFYSIQVNHNSALIPFCAAVLYYGYRYLELRQIKDALAMGLAVGLGMLTKYEIIFAITPVLFICLYTRCFRPAIFSWGSLLSILIAGVLIVPHIYWQFDHHWSSISRAVSSSPVTDISTALFGLWGISIGLVAILGFPLSILWMTRHHWKWLDHEIDASKDQKRLGQLFLLVPVLSVIAAALLTEQSIKALWMLPLAPSVLTGVVLILNVKTAANGTRDLGYVKATTQLSSGIFFVYLLYLFIGEIIDNPAESYLANTRPLSAAAETLWAKHSKLPLKCVVADETKLAPAAVLWMASRPAILPINDRNWTTAEKIADCSETGGIVVKFEIDEPFNVQTEFPNACIADELKIHVPTIFGLARSGWNAKIVYIPPKATPNCT